MLSLNGRCPEHSIRTQVLLKPEVVSQTPLVGIKIIAFEIPITFRILHEEELQIITFS